MPPPARCFALLMEYDGAPFVGWQRQRNGVSVQAILEGAAQNLAREGRIASVVAGRTDAGVHAAGQVVGLTLATELEPSRLASALNFHLKPHPVVVLAARPAPRGWSARFSAIGRVYRYTILNRPARPALAAGRVWHLAKPLDVAAMGAAAESLLGRHDFTSFRASACQAKSPLRTLDRLDVVWGEGEKIEITAVARSFLHHQVRNMVGTLHLVGAGRWAIPDVARALAARDRACAGPTAPPDGLSLVAVRYPAELDPFSREDR